jgi:hypothetical protein
VADNHTDLRAQLVKRLVDQVEEDQYPSTTMMDTIEEMLAPDDVQGYVQVLLAKVADDTYPSIGMIRRNQGPDRLSRTQAPRCCVCAAMTARATCWSGIPACAAASMSWDSAPSRSRPRWAGDHPDGDLHVSAGGQDLRCRGRGQPRGEGEIRVLDRGQGVGMERARQGVDVPSNAFGTPA